MQESMMSDVSVFSIDPTPPKAATSAGAAGAAADVMGLEDMPVALCNLERVFFDREDDAEGGGGEDFEDRDLGGGRVGVSLADSIMRPNAKGQKSQQINWGFKDLNFMIRGQNLRWRGQSACGNRLQLKNSVR
jgi:hypothetical protein